MSERSNLLDLGGRRVEENQLYLDQHSQAIDSFLDSFSHLSEIQEELERKLLVKDSRLTRRDLEKRKALDLELCVFVDEVLDDFVSSGRDVDACVDDELRGLIKHLLLLLQRKRDSLKHGVDFSRYEKPTLLILIMECWRTDSMWKKKLRKNGSSYARTHLMGKHGAVANLIAEGSVTGASNFIGALRHDDVEDLKNIHPDRKMDLKAITAPSLYGEDIVRMTERSDHWRRETVRDELISMRARAALLVEGVTNIKREDQSREWNAGMSFRGMLKAVENLGGVRTLVLRCAERLHNMQDLQGMPKRDRRMAKINETSSALVPFMAVLRSYRLHRELISECFKQRRIEFARDMGLPESEWSSLQGPQERFKEEQKARILALLSEGAGEFLVDDLRLLLEGESRNVSFVGIVPKLFSDYADADFVHDLDYNPELDPLDPLCEITILTRGKEHIRRIRNRIVEIFEDQRGRGRVDIEDSYEGQVPFRGSVIYIKNPAYSRRLVFRVNDQRMEELRSRGVLARGANADKPTPKMQQAIHEVLRKTEDSPERVIEIARKELLKPTIGVITPKDETIEFPRGASVLDFACDLHTDLLEKCQGAWIREHQNARRTEVDVFAELESGQVVDLVLSDQFALRPVYRNFVTSYTANKISRALRRRPEEEKFEIGIEYLSQLAQLFDYESSEEFLFDLLVPLLDEIQIRKYFGVRDIKKIRKKHRNSEEIRKRLVTGLATGSLDPVDLIADRVDLRGQVDCVFVPAEGLRMEQLSTLLSEDDIKAAIHAMADGSWYISMNLDKAKLLQLLDLLSHFGEVRNAKKTGVNLQFELEDVPRLLTKISGELGECDVNIIGSSQVVNEHNPLMTTLNLTVTPDDENYDPEAFIKLLLRMSCRYKLKVTSDHFKPQTITQKFELLDEE